ncbi:efflux RND transporter permease subunit [Perlabentimonas gracilis]|uniref:efflux RND transporter permease subunit n=1 Tax=Perlabentimonas gracilis TaxID=2715279 RepID=UPI00140E243E|nr:MMPL family transporter [Perlabentimonas gracilis]NHB69561.1 RND family transporter [Perlabentimonas gracilis]
MNTNTFITRYWRWLIVVPIIVTLLMVLPLTKARINPDLMAYLPDDIEAKLNNDKLEQIFGKYDPILLIFEADDVLSEQTLQRVEAINATLKYSELVDDVLSLFETKYIRGEDGAMMVDPAVRYLPQTDEEREQLRQELKENPLAYKLMVSDNFRYTSIILNANEGVTDDQIFEFIDATLAENPGDEPVYINGLPFLRYEIQRKAIRDLAILMPLGLIIMLIFLYLSFKERRGVLLPFAVVVMSIALAMGLMPILGYDLSIIAVIVPIMMIAIANNYGVHLIARYQELNASNPSWSMAQIVNESVTQLAKPIVLTALTTIIGIMGLVAHVMLPAKQMGIVSSIAIGFALALSLFFIPAVMLRMPKGKPKAFKTEGKTSFVSHFLTWAGKVSTQSPLRVVFVFVSFMIIAGIGISRLQVSINFEKMLPSDHSLRISTDIANKDFGGTKNINILFEGDIMEPEVIQTMDRFEAELEQDPSVGSATSLASVIRIISRSLNEPNSEFYDKIPDSRQAIAQYIEFYSMSGDPEDFEKLVDFDYTKAVMNIQLVANNMKELNRVEAKIRNLVSQTPYATVVAGQCLIEKQMGNSIVRGQVYSLIFALLAIAILMWIIFRAFSAGLMGSIPLLLTLVCNFGLMGWFGLHLDIGNSLISSIAIGIGVDYTIHLFWRLKYELGLGRDYKVAILNTLTTTGRGIAINAFSVIIGFAVLFFSGIVLLKTFAFLIIFSLLLCLLCALILVPSVALLTRPKFLEKNGASPKL